MSKELREKRMRLNEEIKSLQKRATDEKREFTGDERTSFEKMMTDFDDMTRDINLLDSRATQERLMADEMPKPKEEKRVTMDDVEALGRLIQIKGGRQFSDAEMRAISEQTTVDAEGGYTIQSGFSNKLEVAMLPFGPMAQVATIWNTPKGNDIEWPTLNDTANSGAQIAEATTMDTGETEMVFANKTFKAWKQRAGILRISNELLQDSAFNIMQIVADALGERMARGNNTLFTTAAGTTTVSGIVTGASTSGASGVAATALTRANLVDLKFSVNSAYRQGPKSGYMVNDTTLAAIAKLGFGTADDRPLYQASAIAGEPDRLEGKPVWVNNDLADIGASAKSVLFGDFSKYIIRYAGPSRLVILKERFAEVDEVGVVLLKRIDGQLLDAGTKPVKYLLHAAT